MEYVHLVSVDRGVHTLLYHGRYVAARAIADEIRPWSKNLFLMDIKTLDTKIIKGCNGDEIPTYTKHIQRISRKKSGRGRTKKSGKKSVEQSKKQSAENEQAEPQINTVSDSDPKFTG